MGSCPISAEDAAAVVTVDVHTVKSLVGSGHRYLDVRTEEEFKKGHLENSLNVPFMFFTPQGRVRNPDFVEQVSLVCMKEDSILMGCQSGVRSLQASADLLNAGFGNVKNVGGGYAAWLENGFPVKKPEEELKSFNKPLTQEATTIDITTAKGLLSTGHCYLDVRTVEEFMKGHLEKSLNIPYMFFTPQGRVKNPGFVEQVSLVCKKEDSVLVGCQSGVRSLQASADLLNAGFGNVKNVGDGYAAWLENGFPVKKPEEELKKSIEPQTEEATTIDITTAKSLHSTGHCYLDVRTVEEFKKGHLDNSLNIPYMFFTPQGRVKNEEFVQQVSLVCNKEDHIVVGCQSGVRSLNATTDLLKAGFKNVKNMGGGYAAWIGNDFGVVKLVEEL